MSNRAWQVANSDREYLLPPSIIIGNSSSTWLSVYATTKPHLLLAKIRARMKLARREPLSVISSYRITYMEALLRSHPSYFVLLHPRVKKSTLLQGGRSQRLRSMHRSINQSIIQSPSLCRSACSFCGAGKLACLLAWSRELIHIKLAEIFSLPPWRVVLPIKKASWTESESEREKERERER